jgi:hypothetical protein
MDEGIGSVSESLPLQGVRAPGKQSSGLFSVRTGRQAPEWWLAEGETEEVRNPCPFPANISVKKFVSEYIRIDGNKRDMIE